MNPVNTGKTYTQQFPTTGTNLQTQTGMQTNPTGTNLQTNFPQTGLQSGYTSQNVVHVQLPTEVIQKPVAVHEQIRRERVEEIQPVVNIEKL